MKFKVVRDKSFGVGFWYVWDPDYGKFVFIQLALWQFFIGDYDGETTNA